VYNYPHGAFMQTVKDMTVRELKEIIGNVVEEKFRALLVDPDAGLSLEPEVEKRLRASLRQLRKSRRTIPAADIARRLGVNW